MSHHYEIELTVRYQHDYTQTAEMTVSTEGDAPHGGVSLEIAQVLGMAAGKLVAKIQKDQGEKSPREQLAAHLTKYAADGDEKAVQLLALLTGADGKGEAMAPGAAPSVEELNAMFAQAGYGTTTDAEHPDGAQDYGPGDCVAPTNADGVCTVHGVKH